MLYVLVAPLCSKMTLVICVKDAFLGLQFVNQKLVYREAIVLLSQVCVSPHSRTNNYSFNTDNSKYYCAETRIFFES